MRLILSLIAIVLAPFAALADQPVPYRRIAITENVDFPGGDLAPVFETDFDTCRAICLADQACGAFTFNARANACFPKTGAEGVEHFDGAVSARVYNTPGRILARVSQRQTELSFLNARDLQEARNLAVALPSMHVTGEWSAEALLDAARDSRSSGAPLSALRFTGAALAVTDAADQWVEYARLALSLEGDSRSATRNWKRRGLRAAINGYLRAENPAVQASALVAMAAAFDELRRGRDMIPALRLSNTLAPRRETAEALDNAIAKYGFRVVEHRVDSESAAPRVCMTFSEELKQAGVTYGDYLRTTDRGLVVEAEGHQLCVDGVTHGARYQFALRQGLPAASGEVLNKTVTLDVYVRDRSPTVYFPGRGYVLPAGDVAALPVVTVNSEALDLVLLKVGDRSVLRSLQDETFGKPLSHWQASDFRDTQGIEVWRGSAEVASELNKDVTTRLPLDEAIGGLEPGLYVLQADLAQATRDARPAMQWFVVSDLGLTTYQGNDGLTVFVRSLRDTSAKTGAQVRLISRANTVLAEAETDADGMAQFGRLLLQGRAAAAPAMITVSQGADDYAFLSLTDPEFDLSDRGVEGRPPAPPIDLFLTTDRGAYRVGEVIHATALARTPRAAAVPDLPLTAILRRPDGAEYARHVVQPLGAGGYVLDLPLGNTVPRGTWKLALYSDPEAEALASTDLLVEDFLPERLAVELALPEGPMDPQRPPLLSVDVDYLFGAPGANLPVSGYTRVTAAPGLPQFPGMRFGRHDERVTATVESLASADTDAAGEALMGIALPELPVRDRPLQATTTVELREGNARPVERQITRLLAPTEPLLGIRPLFDGSAEERSQVGFELLGLSPDLTPLPMQVTWTLSRVETRYQWYQTSGRWEWEPITRRTRVTSGEARLGADPIVIEAAVDWGRYELEVERVDGVYLSASLGFTAGWYGGGDAAQTPDVLNVSLDQPSYAVGDTATLRLSPRQSGTVLLSVLSDHVVSHQFVEVAAGDTSLPLTVTEEWGAGAYVTATLLSPAAQPGQTPTRALGLAYAAVAPGDKALSLTLDAPKVLPARAPYQVTLKADGAAPGQTVYATVAGVDLGILNLTGFEAPNPEDYYFGQRALGIGIRDIYGRLIDASQGALGRVRSGGDASAQVRMQAPPPTEDLAVYWSGPLTLDANGEAVLTLDPDGFNGTMRLMAVAWTDSSVGQAVADVTTRDPVVSTASLPRFLAPGDTSLLRLDLTHVDGPAGRAVIDVTATGPVELAQTALPVQVLLAEKGTGLVELPLRALGEGDASLRVALTLPGGETVTKELALGIRANDPELSRSQQFVLHAGDVFTLDDNVFAGFKRGTGHAVLSAGGLAQFNAPGLLAALDRYPYGCTEQVTSRAMPLLAARPLAQAMGLDADQTLDTRVQEAVQTVLTRQSSNGGFGLWRAGSGDLWLDAYVSDFLTRARAAGVEVPEVQLTLALDNLSNRVNYASDFDNGGEGIAYALMVLAREGQAAMSDLRYYADVKTNAFATPMALAQLGAALSFYGDPTRADSLFRAAQKRLQRVRDTQPLWRADYGTLRRDAAAVLTYAVEAGSTAIEPAPLINIATSRPNDPRSTQESLWGVLAANALASAPGNSFVVNGAPITGPLVRVAEQDTLSPLAIETTSDQSETLVLTTFGVPEVPQPAQGNGYQIDRLYFGMDGAPVQPDQVEAGTRLVTLLKVTPIGKREGRLMITDPLPAGFEIDNPNILRSGEVKALSFLTLDTYPENQEFLSDRFRAAVDWRSDRAFQLAYIVRAVSPGSFAHPAALVEDMYRPHLRATSDAGRVQVVR